MPCVCSVWMVELLLAGMVYIQVCALISSSRATKVSILGLPVGIHDVSRAWCVRVFTCVRPRYQEHSKNCEITKGNHGVKLLSIGDGFLWREKKVLFFLVL